MAVKFIGPTLFVINSLHNDQMNISKRRGRVSVFHPLVRGDFLINYCCFAETRLWFLDKNHIHISKRLLGMLLIWIKRWLKWVSKWVQKIIKIRTKAYFWFICSAHVCFDKSWISVILLSFHELKVSMRTNRMHVFFSFLNANWNINHNTTGVESRESF